MPTGAKTEYSYDAMERLTSVQNEKADDSNIAQFDYAYNTRDVRTSVEKTIGAATAQTINYTYDNTDQLTKELSTEATPALNKEYSYDAMGNRITSSVAGTSTSYTSNNLNQVTQTTVGGNNTSITYDANGNMIAIGSKTFGYNDADQLTSVVIPGEKKSEFVYDSNGLKRIAKEYTWDAAANGGAGGWTQTDETRFIYDGMDLIQERAADGSVKASYVRDGNIGGILSRTTADGTFYYHYDGSGNVTSMTDANQNVVAQYSYDAFGNLLSSSGSEADKNPFRFSSKYYDDDTGLYDYGYRSYDASLGRWINRDPMGEDGGLNLYGMVKNNPVSRVDGYGLAPGATYLGDVGQVFMGYGDFILATVKSPIAVYNYYKANGVSLNSTKNLAVGSLAVISLSAYNAMVQGDPRSFGQAWGFSVSVAVPVADQIVEAGFAGALKTYRPNEGIGGIAGQIVKGQRPREALTCGEREIAARFYERTAMQTKNKLAAQARDYNFARARYLRYGGKDFPTTIGEFILRGGWPKGK